MKGLTRFKGIVFALISSGTFGLIPLFSIPLVEDLGVNEANVLFYRFFFSALMMGGICLLHRSNMRIAARHLLPIFGLGALYALTALFLVYAYNYIASGIATTIHFLYPLCVSLLMVLFFGEKPSKVLFLSAILSLIGVGLMCWTDEGSISGWGVFLASLTIVAYGTYIVGLNQLEVGKLPADVLTFYVVLAGALIFFVYAQFDGGGLEPIPSLRAGMHLMALAFFATVVSDFSLIMAVKYAGSTVTAILGSMEPVVAVTVGVLVFAESFSYYALLGFLLILISVVLVILSQRPKAEQGS